MFYGNSLWYKDEASILRLSFVYETYESFSLKCIPRSFFAMSISILYLN